MINVILRGRLGNNMFQYAVGKQLAIKNNAKIRFITERYVGKNDILGRKPIKRFHLFKIGKITYTPMLHQVIAKYIGINRPDYYNNIYIQKKRGFHQEVLSLKNGVYLSGHFQSEKYFSDIEHIVRKDLQFKDDSLEQKGNLFRELIDKKNSVSIHIRRTDYLKFDLFNICNIKYYTKAIEYIQNQLRNPYFFVFSDDIKWCYENLHHTDCEFVDIPAARRDPAIDLQLMSLCKHNIISNSSFSWWAAWLNNNPEKIVITPYKWLNNDEENAKVVQDLIPTDWVPMFF